MSDLFDEQKTVNQRNDKLPFAFPRSTVLYQVIQLAEGREPLNQLLSVNPFYYPSYWLVAVTAQKKDNMLPKQLGFKYEMI